MQNVDSRWTPLEGAVVGDPPSRGILLLALWVLLISSTLGALHEMTSSLVNRIHIDCNASCFSLDTNNGSFNPLR